MKKKHKTPPGLDYLFERHIITKASYQTFWEGYWGNKRQRDRESFVDHYVSDLQQELPFDKRAQMGTITAIRSHAKEQAQRIGGYVIRCTKRGKPSRYGKYFRAIRKGKKK